jgi:hypothetical protein
MFNDKTEENSKLKNINDLIDKKINRLNSFKNEKDLSIINSEGSEPHFYNQKKRGNKNSLEFERMQSNNEDQKENIDNSRKVFDTSDNFSYKHLMVKDKFSFEENEKNKENNNCIVYETNKMKNLSFLGIENHGNLDDKKFKYSKLNGLNRNHSDDDIKLDNNKKNYFDYNSNKTNINQRPILSNNFDLNIDKIYICLEEFQKNIEKDFLDIEEQIENIIEKDIKLLK